MSFIKSVAVVGAGTMGHGIAEVCAIAGYRVSLLDVDDGVLQAALGRIRASLEKLRSKRNIDVDRVMGMISATAGFAGVSDADLIIEAVPERYDVKESTLRAIATNAKEDAIIATNTSTMQITELARATGRPWRFAGTHFFNPPVLMKLVEITKGNETQSDVVDELHGFSIKIGKEPIIVRRDVPGFVVNRLLGRLYNTACLLVTGGNTVEEVDATAKYVLGFPMGCFELADFSGLDIISSMMKILGEKGFTERVCGIFEEKAKSGLLGVKTGSGFYTYSQSRPNIPREMAGRVDPLALIAPMINEGAWLIGNGVAAEDDLDKAFTLGLGYPRGFSGYVSEYKADAIIKELRALWESTGLSEYEPGKHLLEMEKSGR